MLRILGITLAKMVFGGGELKDGLESGNKKSWNVVDSAKGYMVVDHV